MAVNINGSVLSPMNGNCSFNGSVVKKIIFIVIDDIGTIIKNVVVWQKLKKISASSSGNAGSVTGNFQNGAVVTGDISFGKTFAEPPSMNYEVTGGGHWAEHNNGADVTFSNITATGCKYRFNVHDNPGNNYNYSTSFNWNAYGQIWVDDT